MKQGDALLFSMVLENAIRQLLIKPGGKIMNRLLEWILHYGELNTVMTVKQERIRWGGPSNDRRKRETFLTIPVVKKNKRKRRTRWIIDVEEY